MRYVIESWRGDQWGSTTVGCGRINRNALLKDLLSSTEHCLHIPDPERRFIIRRWPNSARSYEGQKVAKELSHSEIVMLWTFFCEKDGCEFRNARWRLNQYSYTAINRLFKGVFKL